MRRGRVPRSDQKRVENGIDPLRGEAICHSSFDRSIYVDDSPSRDRLAPDAAFDDGLQYDGDNNYKAEAELRIEGVDAC